MYAYSPTLGIVETATSTSSRLLLILLILLISLCVGYADVTENKFCMAPLLCTFKDAWRAVMRDRCNDKGKVKVLRTIKAQYRNPLK